MIEIKFKNLEKSEIAKETVTDRIQGIVDKFEDLQASRILVTLEMLNSPVQAGPDLFSVKVYISNGRYRGITIKKSDPNMYRALADVSDHMLEKLNRAGDKKRVKQRKQAREVMSKVIVPDEVR